MSAASRRVARASQKSSRLPAFLLILWLGVACGESASKPHAVTGSSGSFSAPTLAHGGTASGGAAVGAGTGGIAGVSGSAGAVGTAGSADVSGAGGGLGGAGEAGAAGSGCEPSGPDTTSCDDAIEGQILGRWSVTTEDNAQATLSEVTGPSGAKALRLVTASGFLVTLRFEPAVPLQAAETQELRLLLRAKNTNTGWQGNVPAVTLEDAAGSRRTYTPPGVAYPTDGKTWVELRVPLAGGAGYQVTGDALDGAHLKAVELTADTWEAGFTLDLDGLSFVTPAAVCAISCADDCSGRGECSAQKLGCVCEVGATGDSCATCRDGFALKNGHCALSQDGNFDHWPNAVSKTNGDAWLQVHHQEVKTLSPRVLALNFVNPSVPDKVETLLGDVIAGFREGSRPRGAADAAAVPGLDYELVDVVDLRDGVAGRPAAPNGYAYENSTLYPRRPQGQAGAWGLDYAALFSEAFAEHYGFEDPAAAGTYLNLCELVESGRIHELWLVGSGDVPDANAAEVLESKQRYDAARNPLPGAFESCAGNGCFDEDVPRCSRSLRIGFVNYNRGPGCYLHSQGHGLESLANHGVVQSLSDWFLPFAGFDLDKRYGLPSTSFYGVLGEQSHAEYPTSGSLDVVQGGNATHVASYTASCGNVHFPPNANNHYDYGSTTLVNSDCADFGHEVAACRAQQVAPVSAAMWADYEQLSPDCGGAFLVYWFQHMPGYGSAQLFPDGRPMLSVWPFLFY